MLAALLITGCANSQPLTLEERAREINKALICPVCPGETIDQSQNALAKQMREAVREQLEAGKTREEIIQFFVERYGEGVLAAPPKRGFNLVAWLLPPVAITGALLLLVFIVRGMTQRSLPPSQSQAAPSPELKEFLSVVDEELEGQTPHSAGEERGERTSPSKRGNEAIHG